MKDILEEQIAFSPKVQGNPAKAATVVCGGMGGSALPPRVLAELLPETHFILHRDYDLPREQPAGALYVATSYSGNTEEAVSFFEAAHAKGYATAIITSGGTLLTRAGELGIPHVIVPTGMPPRDEFVALTKALIALIGNEEALEEWNAYPSVMKEAEGSGAALSKALQDRIPLVYASGRNEPLAYIGKITLNETAKIPAFSNVFPELNHNEMQGLDALGTNAALISPFTIVLVRDASDRQRVRARMDAFEAVMRKRNIPVHAVSLPEGSRIHALLWFWLSVRAAAHELASVYGVPADDTPLIEDFQKLL